MVLIKKLGNKGTTLVELMVTIAILGLVMTPISIMFFNGYKAYFEENDKMFALRKANEIIEFITNDLRRYEEVTTTVDGATGERLTINNSLIYSYDASGKTILKNGINIFIDNTDVKVIAFKVTEKRDAGYDAAVIVLNVDLEYKKSGVVNLSNAYRRRY